MHAEAPEKNAPFLREATVNALLAITVGILAGSASAFFLWSLDVVTGFRFAHPGLLFGLPAAGVLMVFAYRRFGHTSGRGNNLILEHIHGPGGGVPRRMAPLVLFSTLLSHLCGGSVGREGTAVQMGGSIASAIAHALRIPAAKLPMLLSAGIAAGFGSVFGTPLAGAMFALEVPVRGRLNFAVWLPALLASFAGDLTCHFWKISHTHYPTLHLTAAFWSPVFLLKLVLAAVLFGLCASFFARTTHAIQKAYETWIPFWWLRPITGALLVLGFSLLLKTDNYLGLGVSHPVPGAITLQSAFLESGCTQWSWFWKLLLTSLTLGAGFKGGEVTPLFFIGATLGNALAVILGTPVEIFAALGFVCVFCAASHTPLAGILLGMELFGVQSIPLFSIACFTAHFVCGPAQLYSSQRRHAAAP